MATTVTTMIGPHDDGRTMPLEEFEFAEWVEGHHYELSRGVVTVIDVPNRRHMQLVEAVRDQLYNYKLSNPGTIYMIAAGSDCKILLADLQSERHPDLSVYKTPPPEDVSDEEMWAVWIPEIVIEVVSPSSRQRDYEEKPEEYLQFGVREYWIIDADVREMTVLKRSRGRWKRHVVKPPQFYKTDLLPGLEFSCAAVFDAAENLPGKPQPE